MHRNLTPRESGLTLFLALLLLIYVYYLLIWQPVSDRIAAADAARLGSEAEIQIEEVKAAKLQEMEQALDELEKAPAGSLSEIAPYDNAENIVRILNEALSAADSYNLIFSPVEVEEKIAVRTIQMTFTCQTYASAREIVHTLYCSPYRCTITALDLKAVRQGRGTPQLAEDPVSVKLKILFFESVLSYSQNT